jgi:plastocyanin
MRIQRASVWAFAWLSVMAAACGGDGETGSPSPASSTTTAVTTPAPSTSTTSPGPQPACHSSGTELEIEAEGVEFSTDCLAAPADTPFTIEFHNVTEGVLHNVAIVTTGSGPVETFFEGETFAGEATMTYEVDPIAAGIYKFKCLVHPVLMSGQFVSE